MKSEYQPKLVVVLLSLLFILVVGGVVVLSSSFASSSVIESDAPPELTAAAITTQTVSLSGRLALDVDAVFSGDGSKAAVPVVGSTGGPGIGMLDIISITGGSVITTVNLQGDIMPGVDPVIWTIGGSEVFLMPTTIGLEMVDVGTGAHKMLATWPSRLRSDVDLALSTQSASGVDGTALMPLLNALYAFDLGSSVGATLPITGGLVPGVDIVFHHPPPADDFAVLPTVGHLHVIDVMAQSIRHTIPLTGASGGRLRPDVDTRVVYLGDYERALVPSMDGVYVINIRGGTFERLIPLPSDLVIGSDLAPLNRLTAGPNPWAIMPTVNHLTLFDMLTGVSTTLQLPGRVRSNIDVLIEGQPAIGPGTTVFTATIPVAGVQNLLVRVAVDTSVPSLTIIESLPLPGDIIPAVDATDVITGGKHYLVMPTHGNLSIFNTTDGITTTLTGGPLRDDVDVLINPSAESDVVLPTEGELVIVQGVPPARAVLPTQGNLYVVDIAGGSIENTIPLNRDLMLGVDAVGTDNMGFYNTSYFHVDEDIPTFHKLPLPDHKMIDTTNHVALILLDEGGLAMVDELDGNVLDTLGPDDFGGQGVAGQIALDRMNKIAVVQLEDHSLALIDLLQWHYYGTGFTRTVAHIDLGGYKLRHPVFAPRQGLLLAELDNDTVGIINSFTGEVVTSTLPGPSRYMDVDSLNGYAVVWLADGTLQFIDLWDPAFASTSWKMDGRWVWSEPIFDYINGDVLVYVWDGLSVNLAVVDMATAKTVQTISLPARPVGRMTFDYINKIGVIMLDNRDILVVDLFGDVATSYFISNMLPAELSEPGYRWYGFPPTPVIDYVNKILLVNMTNGEDRYLFLFDLLTGKLINVIGDNEFHEVTEPIWDEDGYPDRIYLAGDKKIALITRADGDVIILDLWKVRWHWWDNSFTWNWNWGCWYWYEWYATDFWGFGSGWQVDVSRGVVFDCLNDLAILQIEKDGVYQVVVIDLLPPCWCEGCCDDCFGPFSNYGDSDPRFFQPPWPVGFEYGGWWSYSVRSRLYLDYWDKRVDFFLEDQPWDVIIVPDTQKIITATLDPPPLIVADTTTPTITSTLVSVVAVGRPSPTSTHQLVQVVGSSGVVTDATAIVYVRNISSPVTIPPAVTLVRPGSLPGFEAYIYGDWGDTICVSAHDLVGNATDYDAACVTVQARIYLPLVLRNYE